MFLQSKRKHNQREKLQRVGGVLFKLPQNYHAEELLGQGTYGAVCSSICKSTGKEVAIKKCVDVFAALEFSIMSLRELKLNEFLAHPNILSFDEILPVDRHFQDIYFVMERMDATLSFIVDEQTLLHSHVTFLTRQILCAVQYLHSCGVMHRDLAISECQEAF